MVPLGSRLKNIIPNASHNYISKICSIELFTLKLSILYYVPQGQNGVKTLDFNVPADDLRIYQILFDDIVDSSDSIPCQ